MSAFAGIGRPDARLPLGGEPRARLLPPEVGVRARERGVRRRLLLVFVLVLLVVAVGYAVAVMSNITAQASLASAQATSQQLVLQQKKYAGVTSTSTLTSAILAAQKQGTSTEVLWADVIGEIAPALPAKTTFVSANLEGRAPWDPALVPTGAFRGQRVATATLVFSSPSPLDATSVARFFTTMPGYVDSSVDSSTLEGESYSTSVTLDLGEKALSARFAKGDGTAQ